MDSTNQERRPVVARAHYDVFLGWPAMAGVGEVIHMQHLCHHGDTLCHPKSGYVTTKLHGTSTCGSKNNAMFSGRELYCPVSYRRRMLAMLISPGKALRVHAKLQIWQPC